MAEYFTSGQVAKRLRVSVSTLKRWSSLRDGSNGEIRNASGWMLFSEDDISHLRKFKREKRRNGRHFSKETLEPAENGSEGK